jgi:hypothetical protein
MRATALASDAGRALSGNMKSLMEIIANTLMKRTTTIARASGVGGLAAAAANAANEEKIAPKTWPPGARRFRCPAPESMSTVIVPVIDSDQHASHGSVSLTGMVVARCRGGGPWEAAGDPGDARLDKCGLTSTFRRTSLRIPAARFRVRVLKFGVPLDAEQLC